MSPRQISNEIKRLTALETSPEAVRDPEVREAIARRKRELNEYYTNTAESVLHGVSGKVVDFFTTSPEEQKVQEDQRRMRKADILRHVPKVN